MLLLCAKQISIQLKLKRESQLAGTVYLVARAAFASQIIIIIFLMVQTSNIAKRQKAEECTSCCMESVMLNSDSLFKIASYLPADGLLNLALTCRRFGIAPVSDGDRDESLSLVEETARRIVQDIATEDQKNALPGYEGENWLCKNNYMQLMRKPLTFDQLVW